MSRKRELGGLFVLWLGLAMQPSCTEDATQGTAATDGGGDGGADAAADADSHDANAAAGATVSGWGTLTGPVAGAVVEAWTLDEALTPIEAVATTTSNDNGTFVLQVPAGIGAGLIEVRLSGAKASYAVGDGAEGFDPDDHLATIVSISPGEATTHVSVHGWTTMAVALARAYASKGDDCASAVQLAFGRVADHLWRPGEDDLRTLPLTAPAEPAYDPARPESKLALTHVGFAGLAARWGEHAGADVKVVDVVTALTRDLDNALFDGLRHAADGSLLPVAVFETKPLSVDTTRRELARAIYDAAPGIDHAPLLASGALYEDLSLDDGLLYPPTPAPQAFDPLAPDLTWEPPTPPDGSIHGEAFVARVAATDEGVVAELAASLLQGEIEAALPVVDLGSTGHERAAEIAVAVDGLSQGLHVLRVTAADGDGNEATIDRTFHVDTAPPSLAVTSNLTATGAAQFELTGTASDPEPAEGLAAGLTRVVVEGGIEPVEATLAGGGWSAKLTLDGSGTHTLVVTAEDGVGNTATADRQVLLDPDGPELAIVSPAVATWMHNPVVIAGTAADAGVGGVNVAVTVDSTSMYTGTEPDGSWSVTFNGLPDGTHTALASAVDGLENESSASRMIKVDSTPPVIELTPGLNGAYTAAASVQITGTITDSGSGPATVDLLTASGTIPAVLGGDDPLTFVASVPVSPSGTTISLVGTDVAGNASVPVEMSITQDVAPPTLTVTSPAVEEVWTNAAVLLEGKASDVGSGVAMVWVAVDGGTPTPAQLWADPANGGATWSRSLAPAPAGSVSEGVHDVAVWAADAVGNESGVEKLTLVVDVTPPVVGLGADLGYAPEDLCSVTFSADGASYQCPESETLLHVLAKLCTPDCGPLKKFPQRLGYGLGTPTSAVVLLHNIPHFKPASSDNASTWTAAGSLTIEYRFHFAVAGGTADTTSWAPIPVQGIVPLATQYWGAATSIPDAKAKLPTGVEFRASDRAGNQSVTPLYTFQIELLSPPPRVEPVDLDETLLLEDGKALSFSGLTAHLPFVTTATGVRVRRLLIANPYPMPLDVTLSTPNPLKKVLYATAEGDRRYGAKTELTFDGTCAPDASVFNLQCQAGETCPGACSASGPAGTAWSRSVAATGFSARIVDPSTGVWTSSKPTKLASGEAVWFDLYAKFTGSCAVPWPQAVAGYGTPDGKVYLRGTSGDCGQSNPVTAADKVTSWYHDKCGYDCPVTGMPVCGSCKDHKYERAAASLVQAVQVSTADKSLLELPVTSTADGAKPYGQLDAPKSVNLIFSHRAETSTGADAPYPTW